MDLDIVVAVLQSAGLAGLGLLVFFYLVVPIARRADGDTQRLIIKLAFALAIAAMVVWAVVEMWPRERPDPPPPNGGPPDAAPAPPDAGPPPDAGGPPNASPPDAGPLPVPDAGPPPPPPNCDEVPAFRDKPCKTADNKRWGMTVRIASISRSYKLKGHRRLQRQVHDPIATALRQRGASLWLNRLTFRTQLQEEWDVMVQPVDPSAASAFCGWISECLIKEIPENVQWLCDEGVASDIMINPRHCPRE